jgi:flagellar biosynthesis protein FlhF
MKIRRFKGRDMRDALNQVKEELGPDAVIMSNKKCADGIELVAAYDQDPVANSAPVQERPVHTVKTTTANPRPTARPTVRPSATLSEIIGDSGQDSLQALLEKQLAKQQAASSASTAATAAPAPTPEPQRAPEPRYESSAAQFAAPQEPMPSTWGNEQAASMRPQAPASAASDIEQIRAEIASLKNVLSSQVADLFEQQHKIKHPTKHFLQQQLQRMGIANELAKQLVNFVPDTADERQAWLFVLKLLANRLTMGGQTLLQDGGVVALVGPTGTGKTTTVAKLAAQFALQHGADSVAMVTIDTYRIAAFEQLATYGKIIGCQVKQAGNSDELAHILYQLRHKKLVLIDSAGFSQRDTRLIQQLSTLENVSNLPIQKYLVVQTSAQYQVLQRTVNAYSNIDLQGCILTKLDECYSLGEAISVAIEHDLPVSYLTDGQKVPEDLSVAQAQALIAKTAKLYQEFSVETEQGVHTSYAANA